MKKVQGLVNKHCENGQFNLFFWAITSWNSQENSLLVFYRLAKTRDDLPCLDSPFERLSD